jgi:hypothetical protein
LNAVVKIATRHGSTLFLVVMVLIMVFVMTLALGLINGAFADGFLRFWPRQFVIAYAVALPTAFVARRLASMAVARFTE